jgi:hypothetical protein
LINLFITRFIITRSITNITIRDITRRWRWRSFGLGFGFYLLTLYHKTNVRGVVVIIGHAGEEP